MKRRLGNLEGGLSRLESGSELELLAAKSNVLSWSAEWLRSVDVETRRDLLDASRHFYELDGVEGAEAEADRVVVLARLRSYAEAEQGFVDERIAEHLAATPPRDRNRWRQLYREARQAAATGSTTAGNGMAGE